MRNIGPMQCSQCGTPHHEDARFCIECGNRFDVQPAVEPVAEPPAPASSTCPTCQVAIDGTERYCRNCGAYLGVVSAAPRIPADALPQAAMPGAATPVQAPALPTAPVIASFGQRLGASLIDLVVGIGILFLATFIVALPTVISTGAENVNDLTDEQLNTMTIVSYALAIGGFIIYSIATEATTGATLGKRAVGLVVRGVDGERIGFGTALVRAVLKPLFVFTVIGYIMIAWNSRHRALYDLVAGTEVLRREPGGQS